MAGQTDDLFEQLMYRCAKPSRTDGKRTLVTDGDPLLLEVFETLGWSDPYVVPDEVPEGEAPPWVPLLIVHKYRQAQDDKPPQIGDGDKPPEIGDGDKPPERPRRTRGPWIPIEHPVATVALGEAVSNGEPRPE